MYPDDASLVVPTLPPAAEIGSLVQTICPQPHLAYYGARHDGADSLRRCAINGDNGGQPYGLHPARIKVLFADGSVRVLRDRIDIRTPVRLATRAGGETLAGGEW